MAEINSIIETMGAKLAASDAVRAWSRTQYEQPCTIMENCDPRNEPGADDCPLVILYAMMKSGGLSAGVKSHHIGVSCVVHDDGKPESIQGVVRFKGGRLVEGLRMMVFTVIRENLLAGLHIQEVVTEYSPIEEFPFCSATMELVLTQEKLIGADPYE